MLKFESEALPSMRFASFGNVSAGREQPSTSARFQFARTSNHKQLLAPCYQLLTRSCSYTKLTQCQKNDISNGS